MMFTDMAVLDLASLTMEAIVEFDYKAQHDDELTITVGDIITNIKKDDGGWWEGQLKGRRVVCDYGCSEDLDEEVCLSIFGLSLSSNLPLSTLEGYLLLLEIMVLNVS
ncbi:hypothetical protein Nmel_002138 [Mimus melanotis]